MLVGNAACWFSANDIMQACWSKKPKAIILHYGQYQYPYCDFARNTADNNRNLYLKDILNEPGQLFSSTCSSLLQAASSSGEQKLHRNGSGTCCIRSMIILFIVLNILSFFPIVQVKYHKVLQILLLCLFVCSYWETDLHIWPLKNCVIKRSLLSGTKYQATICSGTCTWLGCYSHKQIVISGAHPWPYKTLRPQKIVQKSKLLTILIRHLLPLTWSTWQVKN